MGDACYVFGGGAECELVNSRARAWKKSQAPWKKLYGCLAAATPLPWHDVPSRHCRTGNITLS
jgi:hypothetical protein